jgi:N-formylmaleamate deformylase
MPAWSEGYFTANGIKLHYYRSGGNKPPVVINHGAGDDGLCFSRVAKELEGDYDVILPDARGHGKSDSGRGDYSYLARCKDLNALIDALGIDKPMIGGHSMGADTCLHYAAAHPQKVRGVFLEDPPIKLTGESFNIGQRPLNANKAGKLLATTMQPYRLLPRFIGIRMARRMNPTYPDIEIIPWVNSKRRISLDFLNSLPELIFDHEQAIAAIKKITSPVVLFTGDVEKMAIVSPAAAQEMLKANERVELVHLEGASHDIRRTRFEEYMHALRGFLRRIYQSE